MISNPYNKYYKIVIVLLFCFLYYLVCIANPNKDFEIFIGAAKLVSEGKICYEVWLHSGTSGLKYFYSPLFALLLFPLTALSQLGYNSIWFVLNLFFLWRIFKLIHYFLPLDLLPKNKKNLFYVLLLLSVGRFLYDNLQLGQMTIFLVYGSLEALHFIQTKQTFKGAALLALIINIKIIPIAILALLIYKAQLKAALLTVLFLIVFLVIPAPFIGFEFNQTLLNDWWMSLSGTNQKSILDDYGRQSLSSFIPALLMDTPIQFNLKRNVLQLNETTVNLILNIVRLIFLLLIAILLGKPFQKFKNNLDVFYTLALVCLFTPLIFPHQGKYSFFYLLPAYVFVLFHYFKNKEGLFTVREKLSFVLLLLSFTLTTLTTDGLIGRQLSNLCEYLNLILLGALLLFGALVLLRDEKKLIH